MCGDYGGITLICGFSWIRFSTDSPELGYSPPPALWPRRHRAIDPARLISTKRISSVAIYEKSGGRAFLVTLSRMISGRGEKQSSNKQANCFLLIFYGDYSHRR